VKLCPKLAEVVLRSQGIPSFPVVIVGGPKNDKVGRMLKSALCTGVARPFKTTLLSSGDFCKLF
jgi:hypothetical protein